MRPTTLRAGSLFFQLVFINTFGDVVLQKDVFVLFTSDFSISKNGAQRLCWTHTYKSMKA